MSALFRSVWQVSGGPANRSYADVFLKYGVALIGPGDTGAWYAGLKDEDYEGHYVRHLATEMSKGDILLLRKGLSTIQALGLVAGDYEYLSQFDDVNGWDLQHARRVRWFPLPANYTFHGSVFGASPPRLSRVTSPDVLDYANRFVNSPPTDWQLASLPELPLGEPALQEVPDYLQALLAQVADLSPLYWNRTAFGDHPTEDELLAHLVVPFLRALGWQPEQIGVKWRKIDVCVFDRLPRTPEHCRFVVEAKRLGEGIEGARMQAKGYLDELGVTRDIVVTDGIRYRVYRGDNEFEPLAYANLADLKHSALAVLDKLKRP
ncbi:MAG: hypothetical protein OEY86_12385 [Nitrospira sp.]|nr:hypothetical protein [Nitrospira sp.]